MAAAMTPEELREYIRDMPDDEILKITFEPADGKEESHGDGTGSKTEAV